MITKTITVNKDMDMDIIPYLVQSACHYDCALHISEGNKEINMKSIMGMTVLNLRKGTIFELKADGNDETMAVSEIAGCFEA
ncbi:MAG: HPr family phosphocarrier protein [Lachnospiraceae bacterium]|jgi:catabolite repression HPr-like protein/phosphocarrier protein|nr:HPr family phosphocarrier protein [Lachnospiraceae bacterium]MCR5390987.1 HPr family phosphocarrier protein [Lachnospiraceae bacterium]